jgi:hypothetical protein
MTRPLTLADFADVEAEGRARFYPDMVRRGEISPEKAEHDFRCWLAIAQFFRAPADHPDEFHTWDITWDDLEAAAKAALKRREQALADNAKAELIAPLEQRRDAVAAMAWRLTRRAAFFRDLNAQLRAEAEARRLAREKQAA